MILKQKACMSTSTWMDIETGVWRGTWQV